MLCAKQTLYCVTALIQYLTTTVEQGKIETALQLFGFVANCGEYSVQLHTRPLRTPVDCLYLVQLGSAWFCLTFHAFRRILACVGVRRRQHFDWFHAAGRQPLSVKVTGDLRRTDFDSRRKCGGLLVNPVGTEGARYAAGNDNRSGFQL